MPLASCSASSASLFPPSSQEYWRPRELSSQPSPSAEPAHRGSWIRHQVLGLHAAPLPPNSVGHGVEAEPGTEQVFPVHHLNCYSFHSVSLPANLDIRAQLGSRPPVLIRTPRRVAKAIQWSPVCWEDQGMLQSQSQVRGKRLGAVMEGIQRLSADRKLWKCLGGIFPRHSCCAADSRVQRSRLGGPVAGQRRCPVLLLPTNLIT